MIMQKDFDWSHLGFHYTETNCIVRASYTQGQWSSLKATTDKYLRIHASATCLQYGQEAFEGLKAFRGADGKVRVFRMEDNARRMQNSAQGLWMQPVPTELFCEAICLAYRKNKEFLPPYESGATLYFRPLLIGTTPRIGVGPGKDFEFVVIASPIGPYFPSGFACTNFIIDRNVDRAAPLGTGQYKAGGNYAASFRATETAHAKGLSCIFLDAKTKRYIDECGAANFFGIYAAGNGEIEGSRYVTPRSKSILPSITNRSLMTIAKDLGMKVEQRRIPVEELNKMSECGACGTAAVISPIAKIIDPDKNVIYNFGEQPGKVSTALFRRLQDIQYGRCEDTHHWCTVLK